MDINTESNKVMVTGKVISELVFSHEVYDERFYTFTLNIPRLSDNNDNIPITISEKILPSLKMDIGTTVMITGQFRSYNNFSEVGNKLILTIFVRDLKIIENYEEYPNPNIIYLNGYICKPPIYRTTPFGREITDIILAVNRSYNKSDYIPCIAWGRNAKYAMSLSVGDNIVITGRIQSRNYQKKIDEENFIQKTAYEVSITKICSA